MKKKYEKNIDCEKKICKVKKENKYYKNSSLINLNILNVKIDKLINLLEKKEIYDLVELLGDKKKFLIRNFVSGISRGVGTGIGFTIITAIVIYVLQRVVKYNIPIIGKYISDIVDIVEKNL